jgi:prepilin-type N-terminal cleavage/methylation domain-containing protein
MKNVNKNQEQTGFTLIELLVSISIFIIISLIGADYLVQGYRSINIEAQNSDNAKKIRRAMDIMIDEIRGANSSERGDYALAKISSNDIIFYNNVTGDAKRERVRFYFQGNNLVKEIISPDLFNNYNTTPATSTLAYDIYPEEAFYYYNQNNETTTLISDVRMIKIMLKSLNYNSTSFILESSVNLRNLKSN